MRAAGVAMDGAAGGGALVDPTALKTAHALHLRRVACADGRHTWVDSPERENLRSACAGGGRRCVRPEHVARVRQQPPRQPLAAVRVDAGQPEQRRPLEEPDEARLEARVECRAPRPEGRRDA